MRLLEFPCGRRAAVPEEEEATRGEAAAREKGKRRRRASPWRPSLVAISEDAATVAAGGGTLPVKGDAAGRRKARASTTSRVDLRYFKEADCGRYGVTAVVPAFAPAAFIF